MKNQADFNRVLIALDGGALDEKVLRYSAYFLASYKVDRLYLMHVSDDLALSDDIRLKYGDLIAPKEENIEKYLLELYEHEFGADAIEAQVILLEGQAYDQILRQTHIKDIDLMILGRHQTDRDHHLLGSRLTEQGPCSTLLVPENAVSEISEILIPLDFSALGLKSLHFAQTLANRLHADIRCIHLFPSAPKYLKNAESVRELNEALRDQSFKEWQAFKKKNKLPDKLPCSFNENQGDGPERCLFEADYIGADLIVISSKGRTASASVMLGSFCKELVRINKRTPLLVLKNKRENLDFLKALQSLLD